MRVDAAFLVLASGLASAPLSNAAGAASPSPSGKLAQLLGEFDTLVEKDDLAGARDLVRRAAMQPANAEHPAHVKALESAERLAQALADRREAMRKAARALVGKEAELDTTRGKVAGTVDGVTDKAISVKVSVKMRGAGTIETRMKVAWSNLTPEGANELARAGGWRPPAGEAEIVRAILAFRRKDRTAARRAVTSAAGHPLAPHYLSRLGVRAGGARRPGGVGGARPASGTPAASALDLGDGVRIELVIVGPGRYTRHFGRRRIAIEHGFEIGKHEVTQAQYERVMGANPSRVKGPDSPVDGVGWADALAFCTKLSKLTGRKCRLPTQDEWEYAAGAGTGGPYCFGSYNETELAEYAWYIKNAGGKTHPVGRKKANAWGLHDVHGNVAEICKAGSELGPMVIVGGSHSSEANMCAIGALIGTPRATGPDGLPRAVTEKELRLASKFLAMLNAGIRVVVDAPGP